MSLRTVTVTGGTLFDVAASELGDALQWWRLAQINGLTDPRLSGVVTLQVPVRDPTLTDGLPPSGSANVNR